MAYIAPIHGPSAVRHAIKLHFLTPDADCLVVAKSNRLEFYSVTPEDGLDLFFSKVLYGKITMLNKIRPSASSTDHLFVGTDRAMYFTLSWDPGSRQLKTEKSYMDLADRTARLAQTGDRCLIDPTGEFMTLEVYEGIITTIPLVLKDKKKKILESGIIGEPAAARIPEFFVRSSAFLPRPAAKPRLALLYEDHDSKIRLKIRDLSFSAGNGGDSIVEFDDNEAWQRTLMSHPMDLGASHLIPTLGPPHGLLILGETSISYLDDSKYTITKKPLDEATFFVAWERIDNQRYILADDFGKLYLLMLMLNFEEQVEDWRIDVLGTAPRASVLVYLDAGCVFLGSSQGDSAVIRITQSGQGEAGAIEIIQTFANIGPILDFTVMDMGNRSGEGQVNEYSSGQARIVTGSGAWNDGSLRSVRSGVGMEELGVVGEMEFVTNMFSLKTTPSDLFDTLLISFIDESRVFHFGEDGSVEEFAEYKRLTLTQQTLLARNLPDAQILQVTDSSVRVTDLENSMVNSEWIPEYGVITAVAATDRYVIVSVDGTKLVVLDLTQNLSIHSEREFSADEQLACIAMSPSLPNICVVGFWQHSTISVLDIFTLKTLRYTSASEEAVSVPRSLLIANLFDHPHPPTLLVAMADGNVVTFDLDAPNYHFSSKKSTILGTQQASFKALNRGNGLESVFATCEHPSLIYASEGRIVYSSVTADDTVSVCPFDSIPYPGSVAIATSKDLRLALIDTERTTHVQPLAINETVRRVAYSPTLKSFGLGTIKRTLQDGVEMVEGHFKLADEVLFKMLDSYKLRQDEQVECVIRAELDDGTGNLAERFVVGTAYLDDALAENMRGSIRVFEVVEDRVLKVIAELPLRGACRCLAMVGTKIVAALTKTVVVYSFEYTTPSHPSLMKKASYRTATAPIDISVTNNLVAVADLMKSVSVIEYKPGQAGLADSLVEVARHYQTTWGTAVANIAPNTWLESDAEGNLLVLAKDEEGAMEEDKRRLRVQSEISLGEMVNRIRAVDVVSQPDAAIVPRAFLATVDGSIYLFGLISKDKLNLLMQLQANLADCVVSLGNTPFNSFRAFRNQVRQEEEPLRFVDGELLERFLDCSAEMQEKAVEGLGSVDEIRDLVEGLRRLH